MKAASPFLKSGHHFGILKAGACNALGTILKKLRLRSCSSVIAIMNWLLCLLLSKQISPSIAAQCNSHIGSIHSVNRRWCLRWSRPPIRHRAKGTPTLSRIPSLHQAQCSGCQTASISKCSLTSQASDSLLRPQALKDIAFQDRSNSEAESQTPYLRPKVCMYSCVAKPLLSE